MPESNESRQFPRRDFVEEIFCYVDGERLDARSSNLSVGGIFLETDRGPDIPMGATVAVVLKDRVDDLGTVFLFGKVVRKQPDSPSGLGVRWEKAVGPVDKERLATALREVLRIRAFGIEQGAVASTGRVMSVFRFVPEVLDDATEGGPRFDNPVGPELFGGLRPDWKRYSGDGPVTQEIDTSCVGGQANLKAHLTFEGTSIQGRITWLSTTSLRFSTRMVPTDDSLVLAVSFDLPSRTGATPITCHGRVQSVEREENEAASSLVIGIDRLDEGLQQGVLRRYVRWLHAREVAAS
jgi:hypothetical protein